MSLGGVLRPFAEQNDITPRRQSNNALELALSAGPQQALKQRSANPRTNHEIGNNYRE
jgi:hypothetical protein